MRKLSLQLAAPEPEVAYTTSGTRLSAAVVEDPSVIVGTSVYWTPIRSLDEARFLCVVINSDAALQRVIPMQARGWRDPRHFHKLVWELPIPEFDGSLELQRQLEAAAIEAETIANTVVLPEGDYRRKRRAIREALARTGLAARINALVARLLNT